MVGNTGHAHTFSRHACCCLCAVDKRMDEWRSEGDLVAVQGTALADVATPRAALLPTMSGACVHVPQKPCSAGLCVLVSTIVKECLVSSKTLAQQGFFLNHMITLTSACVPAARLLLQEPCYLCVCARVCVDWA